MLHDTNVIFFVFNLGGKNCFFVGLAVLVL
jgi:hypothetical protein